MLPKTIKNMGRQSRRNLLPKNSILKSRRVRSWATERDKKYKEQMEEHLGRLAQGVPLSYILNNFAKYVKRQELGRLLARHQLFQKIADIQGCIVEGGVYAGQGLMTWAQLSAILEPVSGVFRHIYGFDTFAGFPGVHKKDLQGSSDLDWRRGDVKDESFEELNRCIELYDMNRFLDQIPRVTLVKGDFMKTAPKFLKDNPHVLVSMLYLDFDIYEPTKLALELFLPRMPKGSILAFDEINHPFWPGETLALLEMMDLRSIRIQKFPYEVNMSYIVL